MMIPFNKMTPVGNEEKYLLESLRSGQWCGRGPKTLALEKFTAEKCQAKYVFFVTSCSSALEVACLLAQLKPGDEVILPSFGFVSAANAVIMTGAKAVFADVDGETWNVSAQTIEPLITDRTKAILTVHYAGSSAGIDEIRRLCEERKIFLIEDAAQSLGAKRKGIPIGGSPWVTCFSLHETKNVSCGEGGFIMTDSDELAQKIEIIIEKGTNRQKFFRGQVDKYTWVDRGGSYIASDLLAAVALAQMEKLEEVTRRRIEIEKMYHKGLENFKKQIRWQFVPPDVQGNGHIAVFTVTPVKRPQILRALKEKGVGALFHYVPLHESPYAISQGFAPLKDLPHTRYISEGLVRLPIYYSMTNEQVGHVIKCCQEALTQNL